MYEHIGAASGAALGYILDGTRGLNRGIKFGREAGKNFAKNSRTMVVAPKYNGKRKRDDKPKRTKRVRTLGNMPKTRLSSSAVYKRENDGSGVTTAASRRKGNKVHKEGVKKTVKVSRQFKKKVKQSLQHEGYIGTMMETNVQYFVPNTDEQFICQIGRLSQNRRNYFDPCYVLNAASCLYNNKPLTLNPLISDTGNFNYSTFQCTVLKQHVTHRIKNNTARHLTLKVYDVSPKGKQFSDGFEPYVFWKDAMTNEIAGTDLNGRVNLGQATPETLYSTPKLCQGFRNNYTIDETIINLEPGKEYNHKLLGPNNHEYKFQKFLDGRDGGGTTGVFCNQQKFIKQTFIVVYGDLVTGPFPIPQIGAGTSRKIALNGATDEYYGLCVESTVYTKIKLPEQAGFNVAVTVPAGSNPLGNRKSNPYILKNWTNPLNVLYNVVNDDQPATEPPIASR